MAKKFDESILAGLGTNFRQGDLAKYSSDVLTQIAESITKELKDSLKRPFGNPKRRLSGGSQLLQSITYKPKSSAGKQGFDILLNDYYINVNDGRTGSKQKFSRDRSRMIGVPNSAAKLPPYQPIAKWLSKQGWASPSKFGFSVKSKGASSTKNFSNMVTMIQRGIRTKGIEPTYFYTDVINKELEKQIGELLTIQLGKAITINILGGQA